MFRELIRKKQQIGEQECIDLLITEKRGVLSVQGDDGYPYGLPINHWYDPETGNLYFHSGKTGHKVDAVARCDKASFCVIDGGTPSPDSWELRFRSVIVFGRIRPVTDFDRAMQIARELSHKFTDDETYIDGEIKRCAARTLVWELVVEQMIGKRVKES